MKNQDLLLILSVIVVLANSCAAPRFYHKPNEFDEQALNISAHIDVSVKVFPPTDYNYYYNMHIKNSFSDDISQVFSEVRTFEDHRDIDVLLIIHKLRLESRLTGILWFPFIYIGVPYQKNTGIAKLEIQIYNHHNGSLISSYAKKAEVIRWTGFYNYYTSPRALSMAVNSVMDEMKNAILLDKALLSIEKESD